MENNKLLFAIFTIGIVILVLLVVQMCILVPMAMNGGPAHHHPVMCSAQAPAYNFGCAPGFRHFHANKHFPPKHMMHKAQEQAAQPETAQ